MLDKPDMQHAEGLKTSVRYGYAAGDFGLNFYWQGAAFFLLYFYTDILQLPSSLAGIIYAIGGVVDGVSDPVIGLIAERTKSSKGRYRPYLLWGALPLALSFILLFGLPLLFEDIGFIIAAAVVGHILFRLLYTVVSIPYSALGARLTFDAGDRTRLAGTRMVFGALGGIAVVSMLSFLREFMADSTALVVGALISGMIASGLLIITVALTREQSIASHGSMSGDKPVETTEAMDVLRSMFANTPFLLLSHAIFAITVANMVVVKTVLYRFEHILADPSLGTLALIVMTSVPLISIPLWVKLNLKLDKRLAFLLGCISVSVTSIILGFVGEHNAYLSMLVLGLIAASFSAFAVGFWSILPDTIDYGHAKTGVRAEASLVGLASAIQKIAIALAGLGIGFALDVIGYSGGANHTAEVLERLHWFSALTPAIFALIGFLIFFKYAITQDVHSLCVEQIKNKA
ncbi:MFS transporter [Kordiimonas sp. SCSIO 12603]|uniref:MFS transporter n=1 Tax=Kordiimonas sp. SCSIO 12603 TaxID=2829596 RepID=UPI0021050451|nr:MFS transporter [Kordiimonas sp. SCSIO 12603]UTW58747.1 MFS transporter [Kordiimonas sp. SCSIO 12603]